MINYSQEREKTEPKKGLWYGVKPSIILFYTVAACLMFVLGVYVGRGKAPLQYDIPNIEMRLQEVLTGLEKDTLQKKEDLEFYSQLKKDAVVESLPGTDAPDGALVTAPEAPPETATKIILSRSSSEKKRMPDRGPDSSASSGTEENTSAVESPEERESTEAAAPADSAPSNSSKSWTVQVAAFSTPEEAAVNAKKFRDRGYDAYVVESRQDSGKVWYRFRVGRFGNRSDAAAMRERLVSDGAAKAYIIQDN